MKDRIQKIVPSWRVIAISLTFAFITSLVVPRTITPNNPNFDIVFSLLELIALLLPALAIVGQVALSFADHDWMRFTGGSAEIRQITFWFLGVSGLILAVAVVILIRYIEIAQPLYIALSLVIIAMAGFALIPLSIAYHITFQQDPEGMEWVDLINALTEISDAEDLSDDYQELLNDGWPNDANSERGEIVKKEDNDNEDSEEAKRN